MKTTVDIPDEVLKPLMRYAKAATKREVIVAACREYLRKFMVKDFIDNHVGKSKTIMTFDELMDMRWERGKYDPRRYRKLDRDVAGKRTGQSTRPSRRVAG